MYAVYSIDKLNDQFHVEAIMHSQGKGNNLDGPAGKANC